MSKWNILFILLILVIPGLAYDTVEDASTESASTEQPPPPGPGISFLLYFIYFNNFLLLIFVIREIRVCYRRRYHRRVPAAVHLCWSTLKIFIGIENTNPEINLPASSPAPAPAREDDHSL